MPSGTTQEGPPGSEVPGLDRDWCSCITDQHLSVQSAFSFAFPKRDPEGNSRETAPKLITETVCQGAQHKKNGAVGMGFYSGSRQGQDGTAGRTSCLGIPAVLLGEPSAES